VRVGSLSEQSDKIVAHSSKTDTFGERYMINIITKFMACMITLLAMTGALSAAVIPEIPYLTTIDGSAISASGSPNITSTGGDFKYKVNSRGNVKMIYRAKGSNSQITINGAPGIADGMLDKASVVAKNGTITIEGIDPLGDPNKRVTLVTAAYDASGWGFAWDFDFDTANGFDLFGVDTTGISCISTWDFCTTNESFYVAGDFGTGLGGLMYGAIDAQIKVDGSEGGGATSVTTLPVPAAVWLFGSGLLGLVVIAKRKKA